MGRRLHGKLFDAVDNIGEISPLVLCIRSGFLRAIFQDILFITCQITLGLIFNHP